jgi:hypothetical protein
MDGRSNTSDRGPPTGVPRVLAVSRTNCSSYFLADHDAMSFCLGFVVPCALNLPGNDVDQPTFTRPGALTGSRAMR